MILLYNKKAFLSVEISTKSEIFRNKNKKAANIASQAANKYPP